MLVDVLYLRERSSIFMFFQNLSAQFRTMHSTVMKFIRIRIYCSMTVSSKSFMRANSRSDFGKANFQQVRKMDRLDSLRGSTTETYPEETFGPLSNVRFAVFALGSSAYPNFCAYGKYVDNILGELGGERLTKIAYGDEMCGQEHAFRKWAPEVFKV